MLKLEWVPGRFAVCRLDAKEPVPDWAGGASGLLSITRTDRELSIVASAARIPDGVAAERGWSALRVVGTLDFALVGVLSRLTSALADDGVPVFALSTYDTDYLLVKATDAERAEVALGRVAVIA